VDIFGNGSTRATNVSGVTGSIPPGKRDGLEDRSYASSRTAAAHPAIDHGPSASHRGAAVGVPEGLQTMNSSLRVASIKQDSALLEERVRFFAEELEEAQRAGSGTMLYMTTVGAAPRIVVKFDENSADVKIDDDLLGALGNTARSANRIYLHSHSDAYVASEAESQLAIRRAVELRNLLVSLDVEPERVRLFYRGVGNFVANNSTRAGKALNRRVEIELRKF
jgi:outer membrane protein OmpA-like peptidoglycan-associated protein